MEKEAKTTVGELIEMLSKIEDKSLPVICAVDEEVNGFIVPNFVAPQDRGDDDVEGPSRYVLIGTDFSRLFLEDLDVDGYYFKEVFLSEPQAISA